MSTPLRFLDLPILTYPVATVIWTIFFFLPSLPFCSFLSSSPMTLLVSGNSILPEGSTSYLNIYVFLLLSLCHHLYSASRNFMPQRIPSHVLYLILSTLCQALGVLMVKGLNATGWRLIVSQIARKKWDLVRDMIPLMTTLVIIISESSLV